MKRITKLLVVSLLIAYAAMTGCTGKPATTVSLSSEQKFALAKIAAQAAASGLAIRIADLEKHPAENADKIRIFKSAKGFIDEFNNQVADVTTVDLSSRERVRKAIDKALAGADHLAATDVLQINDPAIQADINAAIAVVKSAVKSFDVLFPAAAPTGPTL